MIKIMMHGCNGKMGRMITEIVKMMKMPLLRQVLTHIQKRRMIIRYLIRWKMYGRRRCCDRFFKMREQWIRFWIIAWIRNFRLCFARQGLRKSSLQKQRRRQRRRRC